MEHDLEEMDTTNSNVQTLHQQVTEIVKVSLRNIFLFIFLQFIVIVFFILGNIDSCTFFKNYLKCDCYNFNIAFIILFCYCKLC